MPMRHKIISVLSPILQQEKPELAPNNPLFFLGFVRHNKKIIHDIQHIEAQGMGVISMITAHYRRQDYAQVFAFFREHAYSTLAKDCITVGYLTQHLSHSEFYSLYSLAAYYDQYASGRTLTLKSNGFGRHDAIHIEQGHCHTIAVHRLTNTEGELTPFCRNLIETVLTHSHKESYPFDVGIFTREIQNIPPYLAIAVSFTDSTYGDTLPKPLKSDWAWMPYGLGVENALGGNLQTLPSYPVIEALLFACARDNEHVIKPRLCLGSVSHRTLAKIHLLGFHPVSLLDERANNNLLRPHDRFGGNVYNLGHDQIHAQLGTQTPPCYRLFTCNHLLEIVSHLSKDFPTLQLDLESMVGPLLELSFRKKPGVSQDDYEKKTAGFFFYQFDTFFGEDKLPPEAQYKLMASFYIHFKQIPPPCEGYANAICQRIASHPDVSCILFNS